MMYNFKHSLVKGTLLDNFEILYVFLKLSVIFDYETFVYQKRLIERHLPQLEFALNLHLKKGLLGIKYGGFLMLSWLLNSSQ